MEGKLKIENAEICLKLVALMAQAETGDFEPVCPPLSFYTQWCQYLVDCINDETLEKVATLHSAMKVFFIFFLIKILYQTKSCRSYSM